MKYLYTGVAKKAISWNGATTGGVGITVSTVAESAEQAYVLLLKALEVPSPELYWNIEWTSVVVHE